MDAEKQARKESLQAVHVVIKMLCDEDLLRVQKLVRAQIRARGSLAALQLEIDGGGKNETGVSDEGKARRVQRVQPSTAR